MNERLPAALEVAALVRKAEAQGGFAAVIRRGDPDRGVIILHIVERGVDIALLERTLAQDFTYRWQRGTGGATRAQSRIDPDSWLIELDVADAERFVAEMTASS